MNRKALGVLLLVGAAVLFLVSQIVGGNPLLIMVFSIPSGMVGMVGLLLLLGKIGKKKKLPTE